MDRIRKDALPWMKRIGTLGRWRLFRFTFWTRLGLRSLSVQEGKIIDRPGPGELRVIKRRIMARRRGELRERHEEKNGVPQSSSDQSTARDSPLHPAIFEKSASEKILSNIRSAEQRSHTTAYSLVKTSPGDVQLRLDSFLQTYGRSRRFALSQEIECMLGLCQRDASSRL
jgi:hypothetical protein